MKLNKISAGLLAGVLSVSVLLTGCNKIDPNATLVKTGEGDTAVSLGYYNFASKYQQAIYDIYYTQYFGEDMWTQDMGGSNETTMEDTVKENVLKTIQEAHLSRLHASEYGIELTDDDKAKISEAADKFMEANTDKAIRHIGATKEFVEEFLTDQFYLTKVEKAFKDAQEVTIPDEDANQTTIAYAFLSTQPTTNSETGETVELDEEELENLELQANNLTMAGSATELEERASEYGATYNTYSFTTSADPAEDSLGEDVIKAALKLEDGKTSGVIEVADRGYYIIHMVAKNDSEATENKRQSLINTKKNELYEELLDGWKEGQTWDVNSSLLKKVKYNRTFEMSSSMQEEPQVEEETAE